MKYPKGLLIGLFSAVLLTGTTLLFVYDSY